jgi:hypothetical protein
VRAEALYTIFSSKTIVVFNLLPLVTFLECVGSSGRAALTKVNITFTHVPYVGDYEDQWIRLLEEMSNLRHVHLVLFPLFDFTELRAEQWEFLGLLRRTVEGLGEPVFTWECHGFKTKEFGRLPALVEERLGLDNYKTSRLLLHDSDSQH